MRLGRSIRTLLVLLAFLTFSFIANGQGLASLNGTVTDASGGTVAGATVKLTNTRTNATFTMQAASDGGYRFVDVPPGPNYSLTVTKDGFQTYSLTGLYLPVATQTTKDVQLTLGAITQTIEVVAPGGSVSLNTTDATIGNNMDMHAIENLPNEFRDTPGNLLRLQVGVTNAQTTTGNAISSNVDPNHTRDGSVAGARADQNNIIVDGIDATDFAIGQSFNTQASVPIDAIQEFSTQVAQPTAAYGGRSGAETIITTKSGSNDWHGSVYEYNRTAATEANTFFNKLAGQRRLALVRNQFGGNVGGPVLKDKLFFFFEYDGRRDASQESELQIVPFPHVQNGQIAYINNTPGCNHSARLTSADVSTTCVTILSAAQVQALDPCSSASCAAAPGFVSAGPAPVLLGLFKNRYPAPNDFTQGDGLNTAGLRFNAPDPVVENSYLARVDYNLSANNKIFGRFNVRNNKSVNNNVGVLPIQFPGDPLTALQTLRDRGWAIGDTWTINSNAINQFTYGETRANDQFPIANNQAGTLYELSFFGAFEGSSFATPFVRQTSQGRVVPVPTYRDDLTLIRGKHTFQVGLILNPDKVRSSLVNDFTFIQEGLGGAITGLTAGQRPANLLLQNPVTDSGGSAQSNWDNFFVGDLGIINNFQDAINYTHTGASLPPGSGAKRDWRIMNVAGYLQDSWRARPDLTVTMGVRYQYQGTPYEVHGNEAQFLNTNVDAIVAARIANGLAGISGPDTTPQVTYQLAGKGNGAPPLYQADKKDFSPRLGLAWNPSFSDGFLGKALGERKTVIRAGANLLFDQSVIYAITHLEDESNYLFGNTVSNEFNSGKGTPFALENDPRMNSATAAPFPIVAPPFKNPLTPAAIFNDGIDPKLKTPYSITASFGVQRELPGGLQIEADYYGRFGRRLLMLADTSQAMDFTDPASKQTLVQAFTILEKDAQQGVAAAIVPALPFFEHQVAAGFGDTCAAYNASIPLPYITCTQAVYAQNTAALAQGGTGGILPAIPMPPNVGLTPQFFVNAIMANKGFSSYNSLFITLRKRLSHNLQFDFNYTYSHSIDNGSTVSNENGNYQAGVTSVMCDVTNNSACRGNSEFDATHQINALFVYQLPFGRGQAIGRSAGAWVNEAIGGWQISGIETWHTGFAYTANDTNLGFFDTVSLSADTGILFTGKRSALKSNIHIDTANNNAVQFYADPNAAQAQFTPVTGLQSGNRDTLRGPHFSNLDLSVAKTFPLTSDRYSLKFVAEAYNVLNHANFGIPDTGVTSGSFGVIGGQVGQEPSRVMQFALRFDF